MSRPFVLFALLVAVAAPAWADGVRLRQTDSLPDVTVPVTTIPGTKMGCVVVPAPGTRKITGFRGAHAFACYESTTGEVLVAVLRKNGVVRCSGSGHLDTQNPGCATLTACGTTKTYCLF